jgi:hypothetical protein
MSGRELYKELRKLGSFSTMKIMLSKEDREVSRLKIILKPENSNTDTILMEMKDEMNYENRRRARRRARRPSDTEQIRGILYEAWNRGHEQRFANLSEIATAILTQEVIKVLMRRHHIEFNRAEKLAKERIKSLKDVMKQMRPHIISDTITQIINDLTDIDYDENTPIVCEEAVRDNNTEDALEDLNDNCRDQETMTGTEFLEDIQGRPINRGR